AGVEYIEVRSLDVNPFSPIGINEDQVRFLDLFLAWTALSDSDPMDGCELACWRDNWRKVVLEGRKPGLELQIGCHGEVLTLQAWAKRVFADLRVIAETMDAALGGDAYQAVCAKLETWIENPELTLSAQILAEIKQHGGLGKTGCALGNEYRAVNLQHQYQFYSQDEMEQEVRRSTQAQADIEAKETLNFDAYLTQYFAYTLPT
ncbi:glutamate--cysteine ligase, partial [Vibrio parahaemolyticus]|nr:glutamate--cysteine ligase [Vibrio parahaemolyticus]